MSQPWDHHAHVIVRTPLRINKPSRRLPPRRHPIGLLALLDLVSHTVGKVSEERPDRRRQASPLRAGEMVDPLAADTKEQ